MGTSSSTTSMVRVGAGSTAISPELQDEPKSPQRRPRGARCATSHTGFGVLEHHRDAASGQPARRRAPQPAARGERAQAARGAETHPYTLCAAHERVTDPDRRYRRRGYDGAALRREVPADRLQAGRRVLDEVEHSAADEQVELAPEIEGLQGRLDLLVEPAAREREHLGGRVRPADPCDARAKHRRDPTGAAADVEDGIGGAGTRELHDGVALARQHRFANSMRAAPRVPSCGARIAIGGALYVLHGAVT